MAPEEITEGNQIIAEFMSVPKCDRCSDCGEYKFGIGVFYHPSEMRYHNSWNWLIPVVEQIESIEDPHHGKFQVYIHGNVCSIQGSNLWKSLLPGLSYGDVYLGDVNAIFPTKLESAYYNVVQFLKWYKEFKK